jgi:hypothetical protein
LAVGNLFQERVDDELFQPTLIRDFDERVRILRLEFLELIERHRIFAH